MVLVPGGAFPYQKGSLVDVAAFCIDKYEVTNARYCEFLNAADPTGQHHDDHMEITQAGATYTVVDGKAAYPVRWVSRGDAQAFAAWLSTREGCHYRLPTELEWEKAAAWDEVEQRFYTYGFHSDTIDCNACNYCNTYPICTSSCVGSTSPVGSYSYAQSFYGCYDMSGNLWEWTQTQGYARGGEWASPKDHCATTFRHTFEDIRAEGIGFRLAVGGATILNVTSPTADGHYTAESVIDITVQFSELVNVTGAPTLLLETGPTDRDAAYVGKDQIGRAHV
jgi:formylglycine-generating enzyme required for sulfatase activity